MSQYDTIRKLSFWGLTSPKVAKASRPNSYGRSNIFEDIFMVNFANLKVKLKANYAWVHILDKFCLMFESIPGIIK